jgi:hypothetical protein
VARCGGGRPLARRARRTLGALGTFGALGPLAARLVLGARRAASLEHALVAPLQALGVGPQRLGRQVAPDQLLDVAQVALVARRHQRQRQPEAPARPVRPMRCT